MTAAMTLSDSSVRESERADLVAAIGAAQQTYEKAKADRRHWARLAAQHGVSRRQIASAMGLTVSTVQGLIGRTTTKETR